MSIILRILAPLDAHRRPIWLSANHRQHWAQKAQQTKLWRQSAAVHAMAHALPKGFAKVHITATVHKNNTRPFDVHNLTLTAKAAVDGLVDYGLIDDDSNDYLIGPDMRAGEKWVQPCIVLTITPLPDGPDCD